MRRLLQKSPRSTRVTLSHSPNLERNLETGSGMLGIEERGGAMPSLITSVCARASGRPELVKMWGENGDGTPFGPWHVGVTSSELEEAGRGGEGGRGASHAGSAAQPGDCRF